METLYRIRSWILSIFGLGRKNSDLSDEIESHIALQADLNIEAGMSPQAARREALKRFGNIEYFKEESRDAWRIRVVMDLIRDVRYSARSLWKSKGFSLAVVTTLALCIGANTTILSALYSLVLKPLPVENPERLVQLFNVRKDGTTESSSASSWTQYLDLRELDDLFEGCALRQDVTQIMGEAESARRVEGQKVTVEFFDLMGARPVLGRFFSPHEAKPEDPSNLLVLTQSVWENEYNSDPNVIGMRIPIHDYKDGRLPYTVIGVAPKSMEVFNFNAKYFAPFKIMSSEDTDAGRRYGRGAAVSDLWLRLKEEVSRDLALERIRAIEQRWLEEFSDKRYAWHNDRIAMFDQEHPLRNSLLLLEGGSLLVLLVGCFNIMTLTVNRVNQKRHELSIRGALGAGKFIVWRLLLMECACLVLVATALGSILAWGGNRIINKYLSILNPTTMPVAFDWELFIPVVIAMVGLAVLMSILPFEILWRTKLFQRVDGAARVASAGGLSRKLTNGMVVGQIAVAFAMLIGSALLFRSFQKVLAVDPGFEASQIIQARLDWDTIHSLYKKRSDKRSLKRRIYIAMQEIAGVDGVSFASNELLNPKLGHTFFKRGDEEEKPLAVMWHSVSTEFLATMDISLLEGRHFQPGDSEYAIIVDELFARRYFGDGDVLGAEMYFRKGGPHPGEPWYRVIGVCSRANLLGLEQRDESPILYGHQAVDEGGWSYTVLLRTSRSAGNVIHDMRTKLREIEPGLPLSYAGPLDEKLDELLTGRKAITYLLLSFSGLALLLSIIGVYAVLSYDVSQRRKEIGIRRAIGAGRSCVLKMILRQGASKTGIGLALGLLASLYFTRFLENQLFDVTAVDPWTYLATLLIFLLVALAASYIPARRAVRVDPLESLRL